MVTLAVAGEQIIALKEKQKSCDARIQGKSKWQVGFHMEPFFFTDLMQGSGQLLDLLFTLVNLEQIDLVMMRTMMKVVFKYAQLFMFSSMLKVET